MSRLLRVFLGLVLLAACALPPGQGTSSQAPAVAKVDWLMASSERVPAKELLLVTVDLTDPDELQALGRALQDAHGLILEAEWPLKTIGIHCLVFRVSAAGTMDAALVQLRADKRVRTAEPMREYRTLALNPTPDYTHLQTALRDMAVLSGHRITTGRGVLIGLVDTGVDTGHPELSSQIKLWKDFTGGTAGEIAERHGTAMAGILVARAEDGQGITSVAPSAKIMALRGCWEENGLGRCTTFTLARAINFAILKKVEVLNLSLTGPEDSVLRDLLEEAAKRGIVLVAADDGGTFPASMSAVIGVASRSGNGVALSAPSADVLSTATGDSYDFYSGSSVASAHIAGIAALLRELRPGSDGADISAALRRSTAPSAGPASNGSLNTCIAIQVICSHPDSSGRPPCAAAARCGQG